MTRTGKDLSCEGPERVRVSDSKSDSEDQLCLAIGVKSDMNRGLTRSCTGWRSSEFSQFDSPSSVTERAMVELTAV